jgi:hypothetical protein
VRQEVTTVKLFTTERPSMLPAAFVQVVDVPVRSAAPAHVCLVGQQSVRTSVIAGNRRAAALLQLTPQRGYQGTNGSAGKGTGLDKSRMDGVSGVPPRGRPV